MRKSNNVIPAPTFRILLIDDSRNGLLARKSVLTEQGYSVTASNCPEKGLQIFVESPFDLVVTDDRMPGMSGTELIARLREHSPATPVVLMSGLVEVLGLNEKNTGADAVVAKNASEVQHMVGAVNRLLHRKLSRKPVRSQAAPTNARATNA